MSTGDVGGRVFRFAITVDVGHELLVGIQMSGMGRRRRPLQGEGGAVSAWDASVMRMDGCKRRGNTEAGGCQVWCDDVS